MRFSLGISDLPLFVTVLLLAACGGGEGDGVLVRDSAGVTIVENGHDLTQRVGSMDLSETPVLDIGEIDGPEEYSFSSIEGIALDDEGSFVVADGSSSEVRAYDDGGRHLWSFGRKGNGPGEFQTINAIGGAGGDSVWVYDFSSRRFTILVGGNMERSVTLPAEPPRLVAVGRLEDGRWVLTQPWSPGRVGNAEEFGARRDPVPVIVMGPDGSHFDTVMTAAGGEVVLTAPDGRMMMTRPLFARHTSTAVAGNRIVLGDQSSFEIDVYSAGGALLRSIRVPTVDLAISERAVREWKEEQLQGFPAGQRAERRRALESVPVARQRPAYDRLVVASDGSLWVSDYAQDPFDPEWWTVFDSSGGLVGRLRVPEGFVIHAVSGDLVAGVWRDDLDVEHVRIYTTSTDRY